MLMFMSFATSKLDVRPMSRLFKALGDDTRLRIVALLSHGELCVCHIEAALALSQSNASRQFGVLRAAGVAEARREGNWVYYKLASQSDEECRHMLRALVREFEKKEVLRQDVERLLRVKGPTSCK
jgi:ArsR family transcriptional regulator